MDFEDIHRQHKNIEKKIRRCKESHDHKRLLRLRDQLGRIRQNIEEMKRLYESDESQAGQAVFRRSYGYEFFLEGLLTGRRLQSSRPKSPFSKSIIRPAWVATL
jgi:hypothetical protein